MSQGTTHGRQRGTWNMQAAGSCRPSKISSALDHGWMEQDSRVAGCPAARRPRMNCPIVHAPQVTPHRSRPTGHAPSSRAGAHSRCHAGRAAPVSKGPRLPRGSAPEAPPGPRFLSTVEGLVTAVGHTPEGCARPSIPCAASIHCPLPSGVRVLRTAPPHARATAQRRTTQPHGRPRMSVRLVAGHV